MKNILIQCILQSILQLNTKGVKYKNLIKKKGHLKLTFLNYFSCKKIIYYIMMTE